VHDPLLLVLETLSIGVPDMVDLVDNVDLMDKMDYSGGGRNPAGLVDNVDLISR